jgi:hypothetical protein
LTADPYLFLWIVPEINGQLLVKVVKDLEQADSKSPL